MNTKHYNGAKKHSEPDDRKSLIENRCRSISLRRKKTTEDSEVQKERWLEASEDKNEFNIVLRFNDTLANAGCDIFKADVKRSFSIGDWVCDWVGCIVSGDLAPGSMVAFVDEQPLSPRRD